MLSSGLIRQLNLLLRLWLRPGAAMGEILDRGSLLFATLTAVGFGLLTPSARGLHFYTPLLVRRPNTAPATNDGLFNVRALLSYTFR